VTFSQIRLQFLLISQQAIENTFAIAGKIKSECFCELPPEYEGERLQLLTDSSEFNLTSCEVT